MKDIANKLFDYLGLEPIEIKYEELGEEDSRFYTKELYIVINTKYYNDELETLKCLIHEIRHYYQLVIVAYRIDIEPQYKYWKDELQFNIKLKPEDALCQYIEIDAFAFTKYILNRWFQIEYHHHDKDYDNLLDTFIKRYY